MLNAAHHFGLNIVSHPSFPRLFTLALALAAFLIPNVPSGPGGPGA